MKRLGVALLSFGLLIGSTTLLHANESAAPVKRGPNGCPVESGLKDTEWVCFTLPEAGKIRKAQIIDAATIATYTSPTPKKHFERLWVNVGAEYLPNSATLEPYGLVGVNMGRASLWGGFFGSTPAVGLGWRF